MQQNSTIYQQTYELQEQGKTPCCSKPNQRTITTPTSSKKSTALMTKTAKQILISKAEVNKCVIHNQETQINELTSFLYFCPWLLSRIFGLSVHQPGH